MFWYRSDGLKVKGFLLYPKKSGTYPCLVYNRGGSFDFGKITDRQLYGIMAPIAQAGYVVIASQYRGNDGSDGHDEVGGQDVNDVLNLIPLLKRVDQADTKRIGMFGWSRGGMMTLLALKKLRTLKAAVIGGAPTDQFLEVKLRPRMKLVHQNGSGKKGKALIPELRKRSAIFWADQLPKRTPLLIFHGQSDWRVHPDNSFALARKLQQLGRPYRLKIFEGADHGIHEQWMDVRLETIDWLDRFLKHGERLPNTKPHGE